MPILNRVNVGYECVLLFCIYVHISGESIVAILPYPILIYYMISVNKYMFKLKEIRFCVWNALKWHLDYLSFQQSLQQNVLIHHNMQLAIFNWPLLCHQFFSKDTNIYIFVYIIHMCKNLLWEQFTTLNGHLYVLGTSLLTFLDAKLNGFAVVMTQCLNSIFGKSKWRPICGEKHLEIFHNSKLHWVNVGQHLANIYIIGPLLAEQCMLSRLLVNLNMYICL